MTQFGSRANAHCPHVCPKSRVMRSFKKIPSRAARDTPRSSASSEDVAGKPGWVWVVQVTTAPATMARWLSDLRVSRHPAQSLSLWSSIDQGSPTFWSQVITLETAGCACKYAAKIFTDCMSHVLGFDILRAASLTANCISLLSGDRGMAEPTALLYILHCASSNGSIQWLSL